MTVNLSSPVTGSAQTGFTTPSFTVAADTAPTSNGKQWVVTTASGASGITTSSTSSPFTFTVTRPVNYRMLGAINSQTGQLRQVPRNTFKCLVRHGQSVLAGQPPETMLYMAEFPVPAGADLADPVNVRAGLSFFIGCLNQQSAGLGDTLVTGSF